MTSPLNQPDGIQRRYDLDWLRIGIFFLLILFHIGMFYVPWDWHVKSPHAPINELRVPMVLSSSWRIPALFFISGVALRFALDKSAKQGPFLWNRSVRIMAPVLFGMAVICAPQAYYELLEDGVRVDGWWSFWKGYLAFPWDSPEDWTVITPTWNHLWYLVYVFLISLVVVGMSAVTFRGFQRWLDAIIQQLAAWPPLFFAVPMGAAIFLLWFFQDSVGAPQMVVGDWHRLASSSLLLLFGFAIAKHDAAWQLLWRGRWFSLVGACLLGITVTYLMLVDLPPSWPGDEVFWIARIVFRWFVLFSLFGWGQLIGRGPDRVRNYLTDAVFPYYVLHQTIIVVLGVYLGRNSMPVGWEATLLTLGTVGGCAVIYHVLIRRLGPLAVWLGGRRTPA